jgi:probable HAF family extracellular repeat protein
MSRRLFAPSTAFVTVLAAAALACGDDPQSPETGVPGAPAPSGPAAAVMAAATYTVKDLGTLCGTDARANGINDQGVVVGWSTLRNGHQRAFVWRAGAMKDLGTLGGGTAEANDINSNDVAVGWSTNAAGAQRAVRWANGRISSLGTLGGRNSVATAINDDGIIVGYSDTKAGPYHAFRWQNGTMQDLGTLGGPYSMALDINIGGKVVGVANLSSGVNHAVSWKDGVTKDLGTNGRHSSAADAINTRGQIAATLGPFEDAQGSERDDTDPFIFYRDGWTSIPGGGATTEVHAINSAGLVVGVGYDLQDESGREDAFVAQPGSSTRLPALAPDGVNRVRANDINRFGVIVGGSKKIIGNGFGSVHAVLWRLQ